MGKYDKLKGKLPAFEQEPSFQQKVDEAKNAFLNCTAIDLVREFNLARQMKKKHEEKIVEANIELEALSQLLVESFEASGLSKITLENGLSCFQQTEPYSSVSDQQALLAFLKKEKMQALLSLAWGTMNALNKERLVAGKPPLPGTAVFLKTSIRLRGSAEFSED
jgi:hypothetical protein